MFRRSYSTLAGTLLMIAVVSVARADSLYVAAGDGDVAEVRRLISEGAEVDIMYRYDEPLHAAAARGHIDIVELLIDAGADVNSVA